VKILLICVFCALVMPVYTAQAIEFDIARGIENKAFPGSAFVTVEKKGDKWSINEISYKVPRSRNAGEEILQITPSYSQGTETVRSFYFKDEYELTAAGDTFWCDSARKHFLTCQSPLTDAAGLLTFDMQRYYNDKELAKVIKDTNLSVVLADWESKHSRPEIIDTLHPGFTASNNDILVTFKSVWPIVYKASTIDDAHSIVYFRYHRDEAINEYSVKSTVLVKNISKGGYLSVKALTIYIGDEMFTLKLSAPDMLPPNASEKYTIESTTSKTRELLILYKRDYTPINIGVAALYDVNGEGRNVYNSALYKLKSK